MLKFTIKISLYSLLHVSIHLDHPQEAYAECNFSKSRPKLPEDGPEGPKYVGANIEIF
jgi:hypothetical protein